MSGHLSVIGGVVSPLASQAIINGIVKLEHSIEDVADRWANRVAGLKRENGLFSFATCNPIKLRGASRAFLGLGAFFCLTLGNIIKFACSPVIAVVSFAWLLAQLCFLDGCYDSEKLKTASLFTLYPIFTLLFLLKSIVGMFTAFIGNLCCTCSPNKAEYSSVGAAHSIPLTAADDEAVLP